MVSKRGDSWWVALFNVFGDFMRILTFLNLLDVKGNLSITNILVIAMSVKVLFMPEIDLAAFGAFFTAVVSYKFKTYNSKKS